MDRQTAAALTVGCIAGGAAVLAATRYLAATANEHPHQQFCSSTAEQDWLDQPRQPAPHSAGEAAEGLGAGPAAARRVLEEDEIIAEQLTRTTQFFGLDAQCNLAGAFVIVVGLGGVGSHAAHLLLRSGVGRLRLIDFDQVSLSSLNRHAVATRADVGTPKSACLARHFARILPEARVETHNQMYTADAEAELLSGSPDYVIDAIDNIDTKVALLRACKQRGIPVICVAGAGAKADPTRLHIADLSESTADPLARAVRHKLRREHGIEGGIPIVLSTEKPRCSLVAHPEGNAADYQIVPNFRVRTIPVLGTSPAIFGLAAAAHVLCQLAGQPFRGAPLHRFTLAQFEVQLQRLREREELKYGSAEGVVLDLDEAAYVVRDLWSGRSARAAFAGAPPTADKGLSRCTAELMLTRWDASKPADVDNLVLLTFAEAEAHEQAELADIRQQQAAFAAFVEARLDAARREFFQ